MTDTKTAKEAFTNQVRSIAINTDGIGEKTADKIVNKALSHTTNYTFADLAEKTISSRGNPSLGMELVNISIKGAKKSAIRSVKHDLEVCALGEAREQRDTIEIPLEAVYDQHGRWSRHEDITLIKPHSQYEIDNLDYQSTRRDYYKNYNCWNTFTDEPEDRPTFTPYATANEKDRTLGNCWDLTELYDVPVKPEWMRHDSDIKCYYEEIENAWKKNIRQNLPEWFAGHPIEYIEPQENEDEEAEDET